MYMSSIDPCLFKFFFDRFFRIRLGLAGFWSFWRRPPAIALACRFIVDYFEVLRDLEDFLDREDLAEGSL